MKQWLDFSLGFKSFSCKYRVNRHANQETKTGLVLENSLALKGTYEVIKVGGLREAFKYYELH